MELPVQQSIAAASGQSLVDMAKRLRSYYPEHNKVGRLIGRLIADLKRGKTTEKTVKDARAIQEELGDPTSSAHRIIDEIIATLQ